MSATNNVLMVRPSKFNFNNQTSKSNFFQKNIFECENELNLRVINEFDNLVTILRRYQINVHVLIDNDKPKKPDSIFPNNIFISMEKNKFIYSSMKCLNRRYERNNDITGFLKKNGFDIKFINDYSVYENRNKFLEGTGSLVLDRTNKLAFCALSPRSDKELLQIFCDEYSFEPVIFTAYQNHNNRRAVIYHTNVVMSICSDYSIVCFDAIDSFKEKNHVYKKLKEVGKTIIEINENQLLSFAGNVIELKNIDNESFLVMSSRALNSLNNNQKKMICKFSKIISSDISTIEDVGGGGIRCMIAEIFN